MAKEKAKKKRDGTTGAIQGGAPAVEATPPTGGGAPYNSSEVPTWARWPHPRPDTYYNAPYNAYDWSHPGWPSHMRGAENANFPAEFAGYPPPPRAGFPFPGNIQPPGPLAPSTTPPSAARNSPPSSNVQSDSGKSHSDDSLSDNEDPSRQNRKRKKGDKNKDSSKGKQQPAEENTAKNKRYGIEEVKDLVKFRTELQSKFETMSTHLELWTSIGEKMVEKGHPRRQWESYRDKWDIELRRYQKEYKALLSQSGLSENKEPEHPEQLVFTDETLQEIHNRLNLRPKGALRSRFQSGVGGARGCLGEENSKEVAGKRMKRSSNNNQLLVDSIVEKVVEKVGNFDDTVSAHGFKEVLDAVVNLTNVLLADANPTQQQAGLQELDIDDKVFNWLKSIGKEQYAAQFAASQIDWNNLVLLDKDDLMEMKIPIGPRKFILKEIDKLRPLQVSHHQSQAIISEQQ